MKISVVMPSYLSDYHGGAKNRKEKFHRAVNSFNSQSYPDKELIIVSDGCSITNNEILRYSTSPNVKFFYLPKQEMFSGYVRQYGCEQATGDYICYLDTDDYLGNNHLSNLANSCMCNPNFDWFYFDDTIIYRFHPIYNKILNSENRNVLIQHGSIGTSAIIHKNNPDFSWNNCNGYGHDWTFIDKIKNRPNLKIKGAEYFVCHIPHSSVDC